MIEIANSFFITKVSGVFLRIYSYTSRVKEGCLLSRTNQLKGRPQLSAMKKFLSKLVSILSVIAIQAAVAPLSHAQIEGSVTRVITVPDGAYFRVDGQSYNHAAS